MSDLQTSARKLAALKVFEDMVRAEKEGTRTATLQQLLEEGIERMNIRMDDEPKTVLGKLTITRGRESVRIIDEKAFIAWVKEHNPGEIVESVRESYRKALLKQVQATGELPDGVELRQGDPFPTVTLAPGATEAVLAAVRSGAIQPLALPGGDE